MICLSLTQLEEAFLLISIILEVYITYHWTFWESGSIFQKINQPSFTWGDNEIQNTQITNKEDLLHNALHFYSFFLLKVDCLRTELELWLVCWQLWLWCSLSSVSSLSPAPTRTLVSSSGSLSLSLSGCCLVNQWLRQDLPISSAEWPI